MASNKAIVDDRFKKFGTVSFTANLKVNDFMDHLVDGKVTGTQCQVCGRHFFPPRADCSSCLSSNVKWFDIIGKGKLLSYSKLKFAPKGFEGDLPYSVALLDFGEYKVFGRLDDSVDLSTLTVGADMGIFVKHLDNDQISYVFR